jgi:hypothetical protein
MFSLGRCLLVSAIALSVPCTAFAQPKGDAGSGPTNGATSINDAGSGPTPGAKPNTGAADSTGATTGQNSQTNSSQETQNSAPITAGEDTKPKPVDAEGKKIAP